MTACDSCVVITKTPESCPGYSAHCRAGEHCTHTGADCAAALGVDDHDLTCCHCGASLKD